MSNSHLPNYSRESFTDFLMENGYLGKMSMYSDFISLSKDKQTVNIPYSTTLTKGQIEESLSRTDLTFSDFEIYLNHLDAFEGLISYVDRSKK